MRNLGSTTPNGLSPQASGRFLLLGSLTVWLGSTAILFSLSSSGGAPLFGWAVAGGCASGLLAGFRTRSAAASSDPAIWLFRIISNLIGAGLGFAVIGYLSSGSDVDPRWASFFLAMFAYAVSRDLVKTSFNAIAAHRGAKIREAKRSEQSDLVMELIVLQSTATTQVFRLPYDA